MKSFVLPLAAWFSCATALESAAIDYISPRGKIAIDDNKGWESLSQNVLSKPYEPKRLPNGIINLGLAENWLIQDELAAYLKDNFIIDPLYHLTYGQGAAASPKLREALATYFNEYFNPVYPVNKTEIIVASGVTSLIDSIAWNTCSDNEGIIVPQPLYNGFPTDIHLRGHAKLLKASFVREGHEYSLDDVFDPAKIKDSLQRAWTDYKNQNITMRGVIIANPHNPLGRCYSKDALEAIASFCGEHNIHFISDEIYANSVFENKNATNATPFTSVLSLNVTDIIDPDLVHVMYGMSKDFGASGLRLGALHSRNEQMIKAAFGVNLFSWPSYLAQDMWARLLEDKTATTDFLKKNSDRLATSYEYVTQWLDSLKIEYYHGGNAGLFIWVRILREGSTVTPEQLIGECRKRGVNIGDGQNFLPEGSTGWFRITFSYPRSMLELGLWRLKETLTELKVVSV